MMLGTPPASRPRSWLKTSVLGGWILWCAAASRDEVHVVDERPAGEQAPHALPELGGQVRAPCPIAVVGIDDLEPRLAIALPRDPEFGRSDGLRQMKQLGVATEVQKHADLPQLRFLGHLEDQPAICRVAAHDGDEDHPVRGEVALMQREGGWRFPGRIGPGRFLLHETAHAVRALPSGKLLRKTCRRFGTAVGVADQRPEGSVSMMFVADMIPHPECEYSHSSY
ncbi:hypothetical protein FALB51S_00167 [Frigidibacter albus]